MRISQSAIDIENGMFDGSLRPRSRAKSISVVIVLVYAAREAQAA